MANRSGAKAAITFTKQERAAIVERIQLYFDRELDSAIGAMPAELLLQFFAEEIGAFFYNRGLADAQGVLMGKVDEFNDAIYGLEERAARVRS